MSEDARADEMTGAEEQRVPGAPAGDASPPDAARPSGAWEALPSNVILSEN